MTIKPCDIRTPFPYALSLLVAGICVFGSSPASAQPIPTFLLNQGGLELTNSNLGQSAIAIQKTCAGLIPLNGMGLLTPASGELFARCGELVHTADNFNQNGGSILPRQLGYTDPDELLAAYQQVNGEEMQSAANMAQTASNEQFSTIAARLGALRGAASTSIASVSANGADFMFGTGGGAAAGDAGAPFGAWGWFFRGTYSTGERDPSNPTGFLGEENGFEFDQYGLTIGIDHISGASVWGFALSYSSYEVEMTDRSAGAGIDTQIVTAGDIKADSVTGSIYFDYTTENDMYISALAGYGTQSFETARNFIYFTTNPNGIGNISDQTRSLTAAPDGNSISASISLGRTIVEGGFVFDPHIGLTYDTVTIDRFAEIDSGNVNSASPGAVSAMQLAFDEQDINSLRATLGFQVNKNINTGFGSIRPTFSFDYYHEFEDDPRVIKVKYALEEELANDNSLPTNPFRTGFNDCASCFKLTSEAPDSDFIVVGAGLAAAFRSGFQAFLMFESLLGYKNLEAYSLTLGFRGQF